MAATTKSKRIDGRLADHSELEQLFHLNDSISDFEPPIEIDLSDIFNYRVSILTKSKVEIGELVGVDIRLSAIIYSVAGRVLSREKADNGYWLEIQLDMLPNGMIVELEDLIDKLLP